MPSTSMSVSQSVLSLTLIIFNWRTCLMRRCWPPTGERRTGKPGNWLHMRLTVTTRILLDLNCEAGWWSYRPQLLGRVSEMTCGYLIVGHRHHRGFPIPPAHMMQVFKHDANDFFQATWCRWEWSTTQCWSIHGWRQHTLTSPHTASHQRRSCRWPRRHGCCSLQSRRHDLQYLQWVAKPEGNPDASPMFHAGREVPTRKKRKPVKQCQT